MKINQKTIHKVVIIYLILLSCMLCAPNQNGNQQDITPQQTPLKITIEKQFTSKKKADQAKYDRISDLLKTAQQFFSTLLKVNESKLPNKFHVGELKPCTDVTVNQKHKKEGIPSSDLHIFLTNVPSSSKDDFFVRGQFCSFSPQLKRPIFGRLQFNLNYLPLTKNPDLQYQYELFEIIKAIIHILGFSKDLVKKWNDKSTQSYKYIQEETIRGQKTQILTTGNVVSAARKYYQCDSIKGMQLENEVEKGISSFFWKQTILKDELMTSEIVYELPILSIFTIAMLMDTGFYKVNQNLAGSISWGKEKKCGFFFHACDGEQAKEWFDEFVYEDTEEDEEKKENKFLYEAREPKCTFDGGAQAIPMQEEKMDKCLFNSVSGNNICQNNDYLEQRKKYDEESLNVFSTESKCFQSNLFRSGSDGWKNQQKKKRNKLQTRCYMFKCSNDNKEITVLFKDIPELKVICKANEAGTIKPVELQTTQLGTLKCPSNYALFCTKRVCPGNCSSHGICLRGQCICNPGFSGEDCSRNCPLSKEENECVKSCGFLQYANPDNMCKSSCPDGYFKSEKKCVPCDFSCKNCKGGSPKQCTSCHINENWIKGECQSTIILRKRNDIDKTQKDLKCDLNCKNCQKSASHCTSCQAGMKLDTTKNICVKEANFINKIIGGKKK